MPNFTAGTSFTDGVTNDVTALKLNALVADAVPTSSLALTSTNGTIANFTSSTANITLGTIPTLTTGTTTSTNEVVTNGTITNLSATTSTFLGTITGSTNVVNIGSGQIYKDASGNVGIGTNSPVNNGSAYATLSINGSSGGAQQFMTAGSTIAQIYNDSNALFINAFSGKLTIFQTAGTERLRIASNGQIGIGTTSPTSTLHLSSPDCALTLQDNDTAGNGSNNLTSYVDLRDSGASQTGYIGFAGGPNLEVWNVTASSIRFGTNNMERLRIDSSGNVGIGTASPSAKLEASQSANDECALFKGLNASQTTAICTVDAARNTTNNSFYSYQYYNSGAGENKFLVADSGSVTNKTGSYTAISDIKLKQDIADASSQWEDLKSLRIRKYRFKSEPESPLYIGLIAQEVETVSAGLIDEHPDYSNVEVTNEDGSVSVERQPTGTFTKSVKYSILYMKAVKALQEAMDRIEALESKVTALEAA
jgi:hypothetical protein